MRLTKKHKKIARETILVTISNLIVAILINVLAWRFSLVSGGLTGYALLINLLTSLPTGTLLLAMNMFLVLTALVVIGRGPGMRAIYGFASLSVFIDLTRELLKLQRIPSPPFAASLLMIMILSVAMGTAVSVVLANHYSVGAYSTIYVIVKKFIDIPAQNLFFGLDFTLAIVTSLVFGIEKGIILVVNAILAYWTVRLLLPRFKKIFA